ncbi:MAG: hypothetical protein OEQ53_20950 [Saprospiraceae bacterium]|nr:hypothetical protein [Saprospiraceae bacterium]
MNVNGSDLIAYVEEALKKGTLATIMFHSVGGGYLNVSREAHIELMEYLHENRDVFYIANMLNLAQYIQKERKRLGG